MERYFIKEGYRCNLMETGEAYQHEDAEELAKIFQVHTYRYAARVAKKLGVKSVLDVGCGHGVKLVKYIHPVCAAITGVDQAHSINWCLKHQEVGIWIEEDITCPNFNRNSFDFIISSDVIEHLPDPDLLLNYIRSRSHAETRIVLSTPDRDAFYGVDSFGPSPNRSHVREWNESEFQAYLTDRGFRILEHLHVEDYLKPLHLRIKNALTGVNSKKCQLVLCTPG